MPVSQLIKSLTLDLLYWIKDRCLWIEKFGEYIDFCFKTLKSACEKLPSLTLCLKQFYDIGVTSLPVVIITGFFTGLVLAAQSVYQLSDKGLSGVTGLLVAKAMITELGPVLTAFMVTGRVGAAICAELGTMHVTEQIDALKTMAINPKHYLVLPRVIAGTVAMPLLTIFSMVTGIFGGYLIVTIFFNMTASTYFDMMPLQITIFDLFTGIIKSAIFGILIMTIACFKGMKASGGAAGVGLAITKSVVITYCSILLINFFLTLSLNTLYTQLQKGGY